MNHLREELLKQNRALLKLRNMLLKNLEDVPSESLRISQCGKYTQYYVCSPETRKTYPNGRYLKKQDQQLAHEIAQRDYEQDLLKVVDGQIEIIQKSLKLVDDQNLIKIYESQNVYRQKLIQPRILTDQEYVEGWLNQEYVGKNFKEGDPEIYTERGERVRSKSEKIIADYMFRHHIPYLYEKPLKMEIPNHQPVVFYPDFTILDIENKCEVFYEHCGMMDEMSYVEGAVRKLTFYEKAGIFPGDRLIFTFETKTHPLDTKIMAGLLQPYCKSV